MISDIMQWVKKKKKKKSCQSLIKKNCLVHGHFYKLNSKNVFYNYLFNMVNDCILNKNGLHKLVNKQLKNKVFFNSFVVSSQEKR